MNDTHAALAVAAFIGCVMAGLLGLALHTRAYAAGYADAECAAECPGVDWVRRQERCGCVGETP